MTCLFLYGPWDGECHAIPDETFAVRVPITQREVHVDDPIPEVMPLEYFVYERHYFIFPRFPWEPVRKTSVFFPVGQNFGVG